MSHDTAISRLRWALGLGLAFITVVVIAAQLVVAQMPAATAIDVRVVRLASNQRALCQEIAKNAVSIHEGSTVVEAEARQALDAALSDFARYDHALRHGDQDLGLPGAESGPAADLFASLDRWTRDVSATGEALLREPTGSDYAHRLLTVLFEAERAFVPHMGSIVEAYEQETTLRVRRFRDRETLILIATFMSLAGIALGGIRPVLQGVESEMRRRLAAESRLREKAEELRQTAHAAEAASRAKARFLASMSHEMRTPLNGIVGMAQVLEQSRLSDEQRADLDVIQSSSQALLSLISDVLDLAKVEAGRLQLEEIDFELPGLAREALSIVGPSAATKSIELVTEIDETTPRRVCGDPTRLRQVLLNMLSNAVKFTADGSVTLRLRPAAAQGANGHRVVFEIEDTGIGIDPAQKQRLFSPFTQVDDSTTRRYGGTGLGLAISRQLVECMGGTLDFESQPGKGTTFIFEVDLLDARTCDLSSRQNPSGHEEVHGKLSVLVVDDMQVNRLVTRKLLAKLGHSVDEAADGIEAVSAVAKQPYDVVLMDLQMPNLDGIGATRQIRALGGEKARIPIVALTANALAGDREDILAAGLDEYLSKPIARDRLIEVLAVVTEGRAMPTV